MNKFKLIIILILVCIFANLSPVKANNITNIANYPRVSALEQDIFNATYDNDDVAVRLERLEKKLFGKPNTSMDLSERTDRLEAVIDPDYSSNAVKPNDRIQLTLSALEQQILGHTYNRDSTEKRIKRLEEDVLGASQNGNIEDRLMTLEKALNSSEPQYSSNAIPSFNMGSTGFSHENSYPQCNPTTTQTSGAGMMGVIQNLLMEILRGYIGQTGGYYPYNGYNSGIYPYSSTTNYYPNYSNSNAQYGQSGRVKILN